MIELTCRKGKFPPTADSDSKCNKSIFFFLFKIKVFQQQGLLESGKRSLLSTFQWPRSRVGILADGFV